MQINSTSKSKTSSLFFWIVLFSILYWCYLGLIAQPIIFHDSLGYERMGARIHHEGWTQYFERGPNPEPVYPFLISVAVSLGERFSLPYVTPLKFMQVLLLLASQLLLLKILKEFKMPHLITASILSYFAISPALVNSAFRVFSEIAAYPAILCVLLVSAKAWHFLKTNSDNLKKLKTTFYALLFSFSCLAMTFTKSVFELITPILLIPFIIFAAKKVYKKRKQAAISSVLFIIIFSFFYFIPIHQYKMLNKKHNGMYALTDRGPWALYGNIMRRSEKLTLKRFLAGLAYTPGSGVCQTFFDDETCRFWSYEPSDHYGRTKLAELSAKMSRPETNKELLNLSTKAFFQNPIQHLILMHVESIKMFFWESTKSGMVIYPQWLEKLYALTPICIILSGSTAFLSLFALFFSLSFLWKNKKRHTKRTSLMFFTTLLLLYYIVLHSFFFVLPRYAYPIAPLHLIAIAFLLNQIFYSKAT